MQQPQQERNYTAAAWLSAALTFLFVIPGLIAVLINLVEAHGWKKRTGTSPQGYGCLWAVLAWTLAPLIGFIFLATTLIGAASVAVVSTSSSSTDTGQATDTTYVSPTPVPTAVTITASSLYNDLLSVPENQSATNSRNDANWNCCTYFPENGAIVWTQGNEGNIDIAVFASNDEATTDGDQLRSDGFGVWSQGGCLLSYDETVSLQTLDDYESVLQTYC